MENTTTGLKTEWELEKYFYTGINDPRLNTDLETFLSKADKFYETYYGIVSILKDKDFYLFLESLDSLYDEASKIGRYLLYIGSLDTQDTEIKKETSRIEKIFTDSEEHLLFITEEFKRIGYDRLLEMSNKELFKPYKHSLYEQAINLKYLLSKEEERIILKQSEITDSDLHSELTNSFEYEFNGKIITESDVTSLKDSPNRDERLTAWKLLSEKYSNKQHQIVLGDLYGKVCKDNVIDKELRKYDTVMTSRPNKNY